MTMMEDFKMTETTTTNPTPRIQTELHFTIDGPHSRVEQVREWFKDAFKAWARDNFDQSVWLAEVKKRNGDITVTIPVVGCAVPMVEKLAALFEQEFPGLSM